MLATGKWDRAVFPKRFIRGLLLASKNEINTDCPDDMYPKLKINISEAILATNT
jgi:hypothetical protein